jgi:hypothetical protein
MTDNSNFGNSGRRGRGGRGRRFGAGPRWGRMGGPQAGGPGGICVCPSCNHEVTHQAGQPCANMKCPQCGTRMVRKA